MALCVREINRLALQANSHDVTIIQQAQWTIVQVQIVFNNECT